MGKKRYLCILVIPLVFLSFLFLSTAIGKDGDDIIPSRSFVVTASISDAVEKEEPKPLNVFENIEEKIAQCDTVLKDLNLSVGPKELDFHEDRIGRNEKGLVKSRKKLSDHPRQIGLCLLNTKNGDVSTVQIETQILPEGLKISVPNGYLIDIPARSNGIRWNYWNTMYQVTSPENLVVIRNAFPIREGGVVKNFLYTPYTPDIHREELIAQGKQYVEKTVNQAFQNLGERKVPSRSYKGSNVASIPALKASFFRHLPLLEQGDLMEFVFDPRNTVERTLVLIGANKEVAFSKTCNGSNACGWIQFTPPTYKSIRNTYKAAQLIPDFKTGAADHVNSMMSAILLYDYNLSDLIKKFGPNIAQDPRLEEYLAASYNGAPKWVHQSLSASLARGVSEWTSKLRSETKGFMVKLRYLNESQS